jgi:hypothetical protein
MTFKTQNLTSAVLDIEANVLQALKNYDLHDWWPGVHSQLEKLSELLDGQYPEIRCEVFRKAYAKHKILEELWKHAGASQQDKKYLSGYFFRFYEITLTCEMIRQASRACGVLEMDYQVKECN